MLFPDNFIPVLEGVEVRIYFGKPFVFFRYGEAVEIRLNITGIICCREGGKWLPFRHLPGKLAGGPERIQYNNCYDDENDDKISFHKFMSALPTALLPHHRCRQLARAFAVHQRRRSLLSAPDPALPVDLPEASS